MYLIVLSFGHNRLIKICKIEELSFLHDVDRKNKTILNVIINAYDKKFRNFLISLKKGKSSFS